MKWPSYYSPERKNTWLPAAAFSKIERKISPAVDSIFWPSTSHIVSIVLHASDTTWLRFSFVYSIIAAISPSTALHNPILIFTSISFPAICIPSVLRIVYAWNCKINKDTSNLRIASSLSVHTADGIERVYPMLFKLCCSDIYSFMSIVVFIVIKTRFPT